MERLSWAAVDRYAIEGVSVALRATDPRFLDLVRNYLGKFQVAEPAAEYEALFSADCGVERKLPGGKVARGRLALYFGTMPIYRGRVYEEMAGRFIGFIRDTATRSSNEFLRVRAAAVSLQGRGLLLPSPPQPRLPALAGLLVRAGARYLGDEIVNIDPILHRAHSAGLPLLIDADDLGLYPEIARPTVRSRSRGSEWARSAMQRHPVLAEGLGSLDSDPAPLGWVVFPEIQPGIRATMTPLSTAEATFRFTQACMNLHVWRDRALILIKELVESTPVSRLVVGSVQECAEVLLNASDDIMEEVKS